MFITFFNENLLLSLFLQDELKVKGIVMETLAEERFVALPPTMGPCPNVGLWRLSPLALRVDRVEDGESLLVTHCIRASTLWIYF